MDHIAIVRRFYLRFLSQLFFFLGIGPFGFAQEKDEFSGQESAGKQKISREQLPKAGLSRENAFPEIERDWTEAGEHGRQIRGSVVKLNPNHVLIRLTDGGQEKLIKRSQLSSLDLAFLDLAPIIQTDAIQYEQTRSIWDGMHNGDFPDLKTAKQQLMGFPKSPYGLLMAGVATACTTPNYQEAEGYFEKAYKVLSLKEQLLPDLTPATYVTCCNNYAIVLWRQGNSNTAVKVLLEAASVGPQPAEFLIRNARIIQSENEKRPQKFRISTKSLPQLEELLKKQFVAAGIPLENEYMHFSLNVDGPPAIANLDELLRLHFAGEKMIEERFTDDQIFGDLMVSRNCPFEPWCMGCGGRGVFRCPGRCNRGIVEVPVTVQQAQGIRGEPIFVTKYVQKTCDVCNGRGVGSPCTDCNATGRNQAKRSR